MANNQYYITESEISKIFQISGLPFEFQRLFTRDYASIKRDIADSTEFVEQIGNRVTVAEENIVTTESRLSTAETTIISIDNRMDTAEIDISALEERTDFIELDLSNFHIAFDSHVNAGSAHGASGDIVGTNDYCTALIGGTVLLASAVADQATSTVIVVSTPDAAPAAYTQASAATWVTMLNELKSDLEQLTIDHNAVVTKLNAMLASERSAKQRAI